MRIPNFVFDTVLYRGEGTLVYAGVHETDGEPVVGKMVSGGLRDLRSELAMLQRVRGPGVAAPLGLFDSSDGPVLVQHRFGDMSLGEALRRGKFTVRRALHVAIQLAEVLERIHADRILHRDIKPANVLLESGTDTIVVADFGIAAELPVNARAMPPADLIGTPSYLSPEQTGRTRGGCDARSDLYSFGVTLYELLTGVVPFTTLDLLELVAAHLSKPAEPPMDLDPTLPTVLSDLVLKLLSKAPDQRYQSARGVAADLRRCLETLAPDGTIAWFPLGDSDLLRLKPSRQLYGRDAERATFAAALARAAAGTPTLLLVSGREGSGRGHFTRTLLRIEAISSPCASGEWKAADERPLSGISDAFATLAAQLMLLEDRELSALRKRLGEGLGQVGQVLVDLVPALSDLLGPQPPLAALGPAEARGRLQHAFRRFASVLGAEHVFVLALSNAEHADPASFALIESLLANAEGVRVLVVLSADVPSAFGTLRERPDAVCIELGALALPTFVPWTETLLGREARGVQELAEVIYEKSAGQPGVYLRLLEHLVERGVIERRDGAYTWSLDKVRAEKAPPSLSALAARRVTELQSNARLLLSAVALTDGAEDPPMLAVMTGIDLAELPSLLTALEREGLVSSSARGGHTVSHPAVAESVLRQLPESEQEAMQDRLGAHLLRSLAGSEPQNSAFRVAAALHAGSGELPCDLRVRGAEACALAAEQATALAAYQTAASFLEHGLQLLAADAREQDTESVREQRELALRLEVGLARALMMLAEHTRAEQILAGCCARALSPREIGLVYPSRADNCSVVMNRVRAIEIGLEGLAKLDYAVPAVPTQADWAQVLSLNQRRLSAMGTADHLALPKCSDERALAAIKIISMLATPAAMTGQIALYLLTLETGLSLQLEHGYTDYYASFLSTHAMILHSRLDDFDGARSCYQACLAVQKARPAPAIDGRTQLVLHYLTCPWFGAWKDSLTPLAASIQMSIEAGDPLFAALSASASVTLMAMCGAPLDRIVAFIEEWGSIMKADGGVSANAANVRHIAGKLWRGEDIEQADLDRVSAVSPAAGAMRNNAMVNFGLALASVGHEAQVRTWLDEVRVTFPKVNPSQPHVVTLWLLDGLFAAKDARSGLPERAADAELCAQKLATLQQKSKTTNHQASILLIEAELARARGDVDRASGLYGRAASEARRRELTPLFAYAMEQRATMLDQAGCADEAALFYRESAIAYRRWGNLTKVHQLERQIPTLKTLDLSYAQHATHATLGGVAGAPRTHRATHHGTLNESLDLATVLEVSQDISTQLHGSGVVRAVLRGIAQNAGADRVLLILRDADGSEVVQGEVRADAYSQLGVALADYTGAPQSALRVVRRTVRPLIISDAVNDPAYGSDEFVVASGCRSLAVVPIVRKTQLAGFAILENRLVAGAFTPALIGLTQALVAQAAISLDNASLYENMEQRVHERTAALNAKNAELRLVFDNVAQGLVMADRAGRLSAEGSAILKSWFSDGMPATLVDMFAEDALFGASWEQLTDGFLPVELCIDQLPKHLRRGPQIFELSWRPILDAKEELASMLLVLSDISEALRQQEAEQEQKQMMAIFERLSQDRSGVVEFAREAANIVRELSAARSSPETEKRLVHTLKGNCALFGLSGISSLCHTVETTLLEEQRGLAPEERAEICGAWGAIELRLGRFLDVGGGYMQVRRPDFESALRALVREGHPVAHDLELWKLEALSTRFQRIGEQAVGLAERLGKGPIEVHSDHGGIRVNSEVWAPVWAAFVHAVRNAVDHGLETHAERLALDKERGNLYLRAFFSGGSFVLEFADDGRGIAWERVRQKAQAAGLPAETRGDLVAALFADGISTKDEADENSGRGVGMAALADACQALDAQISVESSPGVGTTWRLTFPSHLAKLPRERRPSLLPSAYPQN